MKLLACFASVFLITCVVGELTNEHAKDPSYYRCPFAMFNSGLPVLQDSGEVMYCDVNGASCPTWHFCAAGFEDGRNVCCHILGV